MPELPEVETIKNVLKPIVIGKKITKIDVLRNVTIQCDINEFVNTLTNKTFKDITRMGKFLIFHLSEDNVMISHLRMEGKYFELEENEKNTYFARVVFHLDNGKKLCYDDSRCFGIMKLAKEDNYKMVKDLAQLGPEPFYVDNPKDIYEKVKKSRLPIKSTLLDQTIMTGLGNIYVDETLFASKINPMTPTNLITLKQWDTIIKNAVITLKAAIEAGGSTIRSYHPGKNIDGNFQVRLKAYGKYGENCPNCGHPFRFTKVGGRGTTYCPICQPKLSKTLSIAITGKIASGKSTVLKYFNEKGYPTISADDVVNELYTNKNFISNFNNTFKSNFENYIDKNQLRNWILKDEKNKKRLEKFVFPYVEKEISSFLKVNSDIKVAEVPLLYESNMEDMFDVIISIDIDETSQLERLNKRNPNTAQALKVINANNAFEKNKIKADFIVNNKGSQTELYKNLDNILNIVKSRLG